MRAATIGLAALVVFGLVTTRAGLSRMVPTSLLPASVRDAAELVRPDEQYGFLEDLVGPTDVVIGSRREDNLVIPALAGRSLALGVPRPFVTDAEERASAQREYLDPATTAVRRDQIEDRYHVRFVLLGAAHPALLEVLEREGAEVVHRGEGLTLLELPGG